MIALACIGWNALSQNQNRDGDTIRRTLENGPLLISRRLHQLSVTVDSRTLKNAGGDPPRAFVLPEFFAPCLAHFAAFFFPPLLRCVPFRISPPPSFPSRKTRCPPLALQTYLGKIGRAEEIAAPSFIVVRSSFSRLLYE